MKVIRLKPLIVAAATFFLTAAAFAGQSASHDSIGLNFFITSPPCPLRDFPTVETISPVPAIIDPFEQDLIPVFCSVDVKKRDNPVKNAKGTFQSELVIRDNNTGQFEIVPLDSGKFKTDSSGFAEFDFEIPAPIFADGFESGDVSAWSYTRTDFTKKKKADSANTLCHTPSSSSSQ